MELPDRDADEQSAAATYTDADEERAHVFTMSARAQKKWEELDTNQNDILDGDEVTLLLC